MKKSPNPMSIEVYNSVGGAAYFQRLLDEWKNAGARVIPYQAISESAYRARRGALGRLALRWRMYADYAWKCWRGARKGRAQSPLRVVTTNPFFAPALVARTAHGNGATINLLYDLFPDALLQSGMIAPGSWTARRCAAVTRYALSECAATVFLGDRLRIQAEATYGPARRAVVIPVGADGLPFKSAPPRLLPDGTPPRILYAGQMGRMHETETLAAAWRWAGTPGVTWSFHASGAGYKLLRETGETQSGLSWGAPLPEAEWQNAMKQAQVALVTIAAGAERVVMPSKTYSALVAGQAILAICRRNSDLADLVCRHECGWVVEPGDVAGLRHALAQIAGDPAGLWAKRNRAFAAGHLHYDMTPVAAAWMTLFEEVSGRTPVREREAQGTSSGLALATSTTGPLNTP